MIVKPGGVTREENVVADGLVIKQPAGNTGDAGRRPSVLNRLCQVQVVRSVLALDNPSPNLDECGIRGSSESIA